MAAFNGDLDHIKLLVDQGVININERDDKGSTIGHKAAGQGHIHILQWLIENGADMKITNQTGETPRDIAVRYSQLAAVKMLESEMDDDSSGNHLRENSYDTNTESKEPLLLSHQQKKDAKSRARRRLEEIEKQVLIARSNYLQLGGKLEEVLPDQTKNEHAVMK